MVDDLAELLAADLTDPAIYSHALIYVSVSGSSPGSAFVKMFLGHLGPPVMYIPPAHLLQRILCRPFFNA